MNQLELLQILLKMIRHNYKNYLLYFYCSILCTAFFFAFLSIYQNQSFMHNMQIDGMISGNSYAPTVLAGLFMLLFIPYAYGAFLKKRKQEYALFLTLGMTQKEVVLNMSAECLILSLSAGITGLICGTGLSVFFLCVLRTLLPHTTIHLELHPETYMQTIFLYTLAVTIALGIHILQLIGSELSELFLANQKEERKRNGSPLKFCFGILLFSAAVPLILHGNAFSRDIIWLVSMGLSLAGIAILAANADILLIKAGKNSWKLPIAFVLQHLKSFRIVSFTAAFFIGISVYFAAECITNYPNLLQNAAVYYPYDLFYVQYESPSQKINLISFAKLRQILNENGVSIVKQDSLPLLRSGACNLVSADEINRIYGTDFQVQQGAFIHLLQIYEHDGYEHNPISFETLHVSLNHGQELQLELQEQHTEILFNPCNSLSTTTLIIHNADFLAIKQSSNEYLSEKAVMIQLDPWKESAPAIQALSASMQNLNRLSEDEEYYWKISSKIGQYHTALQSANVFGFFTFFDILLFLIAANAAIAFKIKAEAEAAQQTCFHLYRVGITANEVQSICFRKNLCYYMLPLLLGILFGVSQSYNTYFVYNFGQASFLSAGIVSAAITFIQAGVLCFTIRRE